MSAFSSTYALKSTLSQVYLQAVERQPELPYQWLFSGWLSSAPEPFRDPEFALRVAQQEVESNPDDGSSKEYLAWAQYRVGDSQACLATLDEVISRSDPDMEATESVRAMALQSLGETSEARAAFDRAVKWSDEFLQTTYVRHWRDAIITFPTPAMVRRLRAEAATMLGISEVSTTAESARPSETSTPTGDADAPNELKTEN